METNPNKNEFILNEILQDYQIPDHPFFYDYLSEIFFDLAEKIKKKFNQ